MKTYVLGFIVLGLTNLMIAQNDFASVTVSNHSPHYSKSKSVKNIDYLNMVNREDISKKIRNFQKVIANYDIKKADVYKSKSHSTYTVVFKEGKNSVEAIYDRSGKLISCLETYQAIKLPYVISSKITKDYPGWRFDNIKCDIFYMKDKGTNITYHIVIKQEGKTKKITI